MTRSFVRRVDALQDAHQRRLAGPVAADHGVDCSRRDGQIDAVVGHDAAKAAGHTASANANLDAGRSAHLKKSGYP